MAEVYCSGVIVPMISTPEQVRFVVQRCKFPPVGVRGQGGPWACFEHGLTTPKEYVERANAQVMVMGQIETVEGIENIDAILAVEGLGMLSYTSMGGYANGP